LVNLKTGLTANNYAGSTVEGTPVVEYDNRVVESENQQWYLKKMELYEVDPGTDTNDNITQKDLIKIYPNPVTDIYSSKYRCYKHNTTTSFSKNIQCGRKMSL
jgi:hypothetical protein